MKYVTRRDSRVNLRTQGSFLRFLRQAAKDKAFTAALQNLRDSIFRSTRVSQSDSGGVIVALSGVNGGEGTSSLAFLLTLSLGAFTHRRIAFLDGRLDLRRFQTISDLLGLGPNDMSLQKGSDEMWAWSNEAQPNVHFLTTPGAEQTLQFYSDSQLSMLLGLLRRNFDFTIIDMPPLLGESCNVFLAPEVDRLYLVAAARRTRRAHLDRCVEVMKESGTDISGIILNQQKAPILSRWFSREYFFD